VRDLRPRIPARSLRRLRLRPARALFLLSGVEDYVEFLTGSPWRGAWVSLLGARSLSFCR
jgi:hypothetical protein